MIEDLTDEKAGNNPFWLPAEEFEAYLCGVNFAEERDPNLWPHLVVFGQWLALAKRVGCPRAMSSDFASLVAPSSSVWEALMSMIEVVEPFKSELSPLKKELHEEVFAQVMALNPWRPRVCISTLFDSYRKWGAPVCFYVPQFVRAQ